MKKFVVLFMLLIAFHAQATSHKVLVVLSSKDTLTLKNGKTYKTGFFLNELMVPIKGLIDAGYEPVFSTPLGNRAYMDQVSDSPRWFANDEQKYQEAKSLLKSLKSFHFPIKLSQIRKQDLSQYRGIFIPGGHAPMEDLFFDKDLGEVLKYFHRAKKPTALICHGPVALLSTLTVKTVQEWPYSGYDMTSFSTDEESLPVKFYLDQALKQAGGNVSVAPKWQSNVVRDRELITGQNPMSDLEFTNTLIEALNEGR